MKLSIEIKSLLAELFLVISHSESQLNVAREILSSQVYFDPLKLFNLLTSTSFITTTQITEFLNNNSVPHSPHEVFTLVSSWGREGRLDFNDFLRLLAPSRLPCQVKCDLELGLARVFQKELDLVRRVESLRTQISNMPDFNMPGLFASVGREFILEEDIRVFVKEVTGRWDDVAPAMQRMDKDRDGKVSYSEFVQMMMPTQPYYQLGNQSTEKLSEKYRESLKPSPYVMHRSLSRSPSKSRKEIQSSTKQLVNAFREQIAFDKELETIRQELALRSDFTIPDLYKFFSAGKKLVSQLKLEKGFRRLKVFSTPYELDLLFKHYDRDQDKQLNKSDFQDILDPRMPKYSQVLNTKRPSQRFSEETKSTLHKLFRTLLDMELTAENLRKKLHFSITNLPEVFERIDQGGKGYITVEDLRNILQENGILPTERDLLALAARYDRSQSGHISYKEFSQELRPYNIL